MQVELWARNAPRTQVAGAAIGTVLVAALLAGSLITSGGATSTALSPGLAARQPAGTVGPTGTDATTPGDIAATVPGAADDSAPNTLGQSGATGAGPRSPGAGAAGGPAASRPLTATDRGVTSTSIKVGFSVVSFGPLTGSNLASSERDDIPQYIAALVAYQNGLGGINGRKIVADIKSVDGTSESAQNQACLAFTQDDKVFGIVDGAFTFATQRMCVAQQNQTPLVTSLVEQQSMQSNGMYVSLLPADDRLVHDWVAALKSTGALKPGLVVGILGDQCTGTNAVEHGPLTTLLKQAGVDEIKYGDVSCSADGVSEESNVAVQFKLANVGLVLPATNSVLVTVFMQSAQQQAYHPKYFASDFWQGATDTSASTYPPAQFDGAMGVSSAYVGVDPVTAELRRCSDIATKAGLPPVTRAPDNFTAITTCDEFFLFVDAAIAAGADLTRTRWSQGVQQLGTRPLAWMPAATFRPGRLDGGSKVRLMTWRAGCTCWNPTGAFNTSVTGQ